MFPTIKTLSDLVPHIQHDSQIRVKVEPNGYTVVCYMLQDEDTFYSENARFARECRGITFAPDGTIAARTMHKFFNMGESDEVSLPNLPWERVTRVMEKRDGSMVTPVLMDQHLNPDGAITRIAKPTFKFKTKKSFDTPEAALADYIARDANYHLWILHLLQAGFTPTFEITSPKFPIVVLYEKDELTLLHVRDMTSGEYLTEREIKFLNPPMPIVQNLMHEFLDYFGGVGEIPDENGKIGFFEEGFSPMKMIKAAKEKTGIEGWIVQFNTGEMIKVKTEWYVNLHHSVTFTRWRDVARAVLADQADDLKGAFAMTGRSILPIEHVSQMIKTQTEAIQALVDTAAKLGQQSNLTVKDMALMHKDNPYFGLIMRQFRGSDINWQEYYEKNFIDKWSLEVIPTNYGEHDAPPPVL